MRDECLPLRLDAGLSTMTVLDQRTGIRAPRPAPAPGAPETPGRRPRRSSFLQVTIAVEGVATAYLVAIDGTPLWQVVRGVVVLLAFGVAVWWHPHRESWWNGIRCAVPGFFGMAIGAGIGAMHLAKHGDAPTTVSGLVVLATGLILLVGGTVVLIRRAHRWWRMLALPIAYVVLEIGLFPVTMGIAASNVPPGALGSNTPADYGLSYQSVSVTATDGIALSGWYVPSRNGAAVVVVAGSGSTREGVLAQGAVLARHGYGVLFLDNRGHGVSGGNAMDFGWYGDQDLGGAITWLASRPDVTGGRLGVLGESMGGEEAIGALGSNPAIRAVVAEGVTGRIASDHAWLPSTPAGYVMRVESWVTYSTANLLTGAREPASLVSSLRAAASRPVLLISGRDEIQAGQYFRKASPTNVRLLQLTDTGHTAGLQTHPALWSEQVINFLNASLGVTS